MTVINGIEIDNINYTRDTIKYAINNNDKIEDKLNVVTVISNPCLYAKRYILMKEFIKRMENDEEYVNLFIVELAYGNQKYIITEANNKNHLQIRTEVPLWHKENMINLGIRKLLPANWKAVAWIDGDIEFESPTWASDTLKILNGLSDIVQLFSHAIDMDKKQYALNLFSGFGHQSTKGLNYCQKGINYWHPGYAWAITRKAYEKIGGLYEVSILGAGDHIMAYSLINRGAHATNENSSDDYKNSVIIYQQKMKTLRLGYTPGVIRHHYHGSKINRKYTERWKILTKHNYQPSIHVQTDVNGIIVPTKEFTQEFKDDIYNYFLERKEDD